MALLAEITFDPRTADQRGAARRMLRLEVEHAVTDGLGRAVIRNLSETGLLLESPMALAVGESLTVALPEAGSVEATVVWARRPFFGCEFARPVSRAAVSAAQLVSPIVEPPIALATPVDRTWTLAEPAPRPLRADRSGEAMLALALLASAAAAFAVAILALQFG